MRLMLLFGLATLTTLVTAFQNCSETMKPHGSDGQGKTIIGPSSGYTKVVFDPHLEIARPGVDAVRVEADLAAGSLLLDPKDGSAAKSCSLDAARLDRLKGILANSKICEPGPLPPGTAACMAIGLSDIELSNGASSIQLRPVVCHNGVFLCDGADEALRALLADLRDNAPAACR